MAGHAGSNDDDIAKHILVVLSTTQYACSSLVRLDGGAVNFSFRGVLQRPVNNHGSVIIKHAASHLARNVDFRLDVERSQFERHALSTLASFSAVLRPGISIRTPTIYEGLELPDNTMTVLEDLPSAIDLSSWLRSYGTSTPKSQLQSLGRTIGAWLRRFHDWAMSDAPSAKDLRLRVAENTAMKDLKWTINMGRYHPAPDEFPKLEWEPKAVYEDIERDLRRRVFEEGQMVIHGDFWPGNILIKDQPLPDPASDASTDVFVVDFEFCHIGSRAQDLGQCFAELYMSCQGDRYAAAMRTIAAIVEGYAPDNQTSSDQHLLTEAIMHMGIHIAVFPWNIGKPRDKKTEQTVAYGNELLVRAWRGATEPVFVNVLKDLVRGRIQDDCGRCSTILTHTLSASEEHVERSTVRHIPR